MTTPSSTINNGLLSHNNNIDNVSSSDTGHHQALFNLQFTDFELLKKHVTEYASKSQVILYSNSRDKRSVKIGDEVVEMPKRGSFYCSSR